MKKQTQFRLGRFPILRPESGWPAKRRSNGAPVERRPAGQAAAGQTRRDREMGNEKANPVFTLQFYNFASNRSQYPQCRRMFIVPAAYLLIYRNREVE